MGILKIDITKAKATVEVETDNIPEAMYALALKEGLKVLLNKGMTKITTAKLEGDELAKAQAAALEKGQENLEALMAGKIKAGRSAASGAKVSGVVMTEARRLAKEVVKTELKKAGYKISHVEARDITAAANKLIEADPSYIEKATENLANRASVKAAIDIASLVHESPKLKERAEKEKAAAKSQLSAKQAGKTAAPRKSKPAATATA